MLGNTQINILQQVSPTSALFSISPKVFGCIFFFHIDEASKSKLNPKAFKCIFFCYSPTHKGYKCYHPFTHRKFVFINVTFHETIMFFYVGKSTLKGESCVNDVETSTPMLVPTFFYDPGSHTEVVDNQGEQGEKHLQVYEQRPNEIVTEEWRPSCPRPWYLLNHK